MITMTANLDYDNKSYLNGYIPPLDVSTSNSYIPESFGLTKSERERDYAVMRDLLSCILEKDLSEENDDNSKHCLDKLLDVD